MAAVTHLQETVMGVDAKTAGKKFDRSALRRIWNRWWCAVLCALPGLAEAPMVWVIDCLEAARGARVDLVRDWFDCQLEKAFNSFVLAAKAALKHIQNSAHSSLEDLLSVATEFFNKLLSREPMTSEAPEPTPDLAHVSSCCQPVLFKIAGFACGSPEELTRLTAGLAKNITADLQPESNALWSNIYKKKWPTFSEFLDLQGPQDWADLYQQTLNGKTEVVLEVFDREKKLGFAMAAMAARVTYDDISCSYKAKYISAGEVHPESIPCWEEHRLRCCPPAVRGKLQPRVLPECAEELLCKPGDLPQPLGDMYPYSVLQGFEGLQPGVGIELQWKMQYGSPFGWWYGHLDTIDFDKDGMLATATISFRHFPVNSRWYTLQVRFGDSQMRPCTFGGFTGGIRVTTEVEMKRWMNFFPRKAAVL